MNQNRLLTKGNAMMRKNKITLTAFALAACFSTACADTLLFKDDFSNTNQSRIGWGLSAPYSYDANEQLVLWDNFGRADTNNVQANTYVVFHAIPNLSGPLPDNQTLELRADIVSANDEDAGASVHYVNVGSGILGIGYIYGKSQHNVWLAKWLGGGGNNPFCYFFYEHDQITNQNITLVLALTRLGSSLSIKTHVLDRNNGNAVLFERTVTDTPQIDPTVPNRSADGWLCYPDQAGTPWPVSNASGSIGVGMTWETATRAQPNAQVIFDNAEVWQYQYPQLAIQNAVVLSWPLTESQFALETASSLSGPWALVANPWWSTNAGLNQVSIVAPDSTKFFRLLHLGP
jgi:hypothetical protein